MSQGSSGIPKIKRGRPFANLRQPPGSAPTKLSFSSRYDHRFPAPDDESFDSVDQVGFAFQFLAFVVAIFIVTAFVASFIFVPMLGRLMVG
jgi:hypothetical protein